MTSREYASSSSRRSHSCTIVFGLYDPSSQTVARVSMPDPTPMGAWGLRSEKLATTLNLRVLRLVRCELESATKLVVQLEDGGNRVICCRDQGSRLWLHEYRHQYFGETIGRLCVLEVRTWGWLPPATASDFELPLRDIYGLRKQVYWPNGGHPARVLNYGGKTK